MDKPESSSKLEKNDYTARLFLRLHNMVIMGYTPMGIEVIECYIKA
jgi:hypothetical protein